MTNEAGKGSRPRPFSVAQDEYNRRWDAIFARELEEKVENLVDNLVKDNYNKETEKNKVDKV